MGQATQQRTTVDVRGEICPYPMLRAKAAMEGAVLGEVLDLLTDHPPALTTVPWQAQKLGFTAEVRELGGADWKITLSRPEDT
jgi:TusA-related sulfurtransferase